MKLLKTISIILLSFSINTAFAADEAAKETTTPPAPEGVLTLDDIQPIPGNAEKPAAPINSVTQTPSGNPPIPPNLPSKP